MVERRKGIRKTDDVNKTEEYAKEYLQYRQEQEVSAYTLKPERSALGMLYSKKIDFELPVRNSKGITRSRLETEGRIYQN